MKQIVINMAEMQTIRDVHRIFREELNFPEYYGNNLDALYDMLSTWTEPLHIEVRTNTDRSWIRLLQVLKDAGRENRRITVDIVS